jgi:hypothetical protein
VPSLYRALSHEECQTRTGGVLRTMRTNDKQTRYDNTSFVFSFIRGFRDLTPAITCGG